MRKLFLTFVAFLALCLATAGCVTTSLTYKEKIEMGDKAKIVDIWQNSTQRSELGSLTVVVANPTEAPVAADVSCRFEDESLFGSTEANVPAYSKRKIMVRGFHQCPAEACESEKVLCSMRLR